MTDHLPSKEKPVLNHEEAYELACYKREGSNLARCYIDLHAEIDRLRACLTSVQGCATCSVCRGAARLVLGGEGKS